MILSSCDCATALWYGTVLARVDDGMINQPPAVPAIATWDKGYPSHDVLCS